MASDVTYADFILEYPDFESPSSARQAEIQRKLNNAEFKVYRPDWGTEKADLAVIHLCAHRLMLNGRTSKHGGAGAGPVTARTSGENVTGYASPLQNNKTDTYRSTQAGMAYLELRQTIPWTPIVVGAS